MYMQDLALIEKIEKINLVLMEVDTGTIAGQCGAHWPCQAVYTASC